MAHRIKKAALFMLVLAVLMPFFSITVGANLSQIRREREELQRNITNTRRQLEQNQRFLNEAEREINALDMQLMYVLNNIIILSESLELVEERLEQAVITLYAAREYRETQETIVRERLRDLHEHGPMNILDVLVQSASVRDFMLRLEFITRISRQDQTMLERLEEAEERYLASVNEEASQRTQLENLLFSFERSYAEYEFLMEQWEARREELTQTHQTYEEMLAAYQAQDRTAAQREAQEVRRLELEAAAERQRLAALAAQNFNGELLWPVPGFWHISSGFGMRPNPFNRRVMQMHQGIDIAGSGINGQPVVASARGFVTMAATGWNGGYGTMIVLYHENGVETVYAHLSRLQVRVGDRVEAGQTIGNVGSTGQSTGAHLHFEVRVAGQRRNPEPFLRG
jgi:murein DD-endopeptidase MepM/ murein hydrolase activator NlpD